MDDKIKFVNEKMLKVLQKLLEEKKIDSKILFRILNLMRILM